MIKNNILPLLLFIVGLNTTLLSSDGVDAMVTKKEGALTRAVTLGQYSTVERKLDELLTYFYGSETSSLTDPQGRTEEFLNNKLSVPDQVKMLVKYSFCSLFPTKDEAEKFAENINRAYILYEKEQYTQLETFLSTLRGSPINHLCAIIGNSFESWTEIYTEDFVETDTYQNDTLELMWNIFFMRFARQAAARTEDYWAYFKEKIRHGLQGLEEGSTIHDKEVFDKAILYFNEIALNAAQIIGDYAYQQLIAIINDAAHGEEEVTKWGARNDPDNLSRVLAKQNYLAKWSHENDTTYYDTYINKNESFTGFFSPALQANPSCVLRLPIPKIAIQDRPASMTLEGGGGEGAAGGAGAGREAWA
jgi:hypothetical protein